MLFDLRGRRKTAVKVVYAVLAVLMGASLFLVVGPVNLGEIFNGNSASSSATKQFEEQSEHLEAKVKKDPENSDLLLALTRSQVNEGNSQVVVEPSGAPAMTLAAVQSYQAASQSWSEYLDATEEPSSGLAILMAPVFVTLAEYPRSLPEAEDNITAAAEAQKIVAEQRPSLNSYSTLALYTYFTGDYAAAEAAEKKALTYTSSKTERESVEKQGEEAKKRAEKAQAQLKKAEQESKKAAKSAGKSASPGNSPLGGAFGGSPGLAE